MAEEESGWSLLWESPVKELTLGVQSQRDSDNPQMRLSQVENVGLFADCTLYYTANCMTGSELIPVMTITIIRSMIGSVAVTDLLVRIQRQ